MTCLLSRQDLKENSKPQRSIGLVIGLEGCSCPYHVRSSPTSRLGGGNTPGSSGEPGLAAKPDTPGPSFRVVHKLLSPLALTLP